MHVVVLETLRRTFAKIIAQWLAIKEYSGVENEESPQMRRFVDCT